METMIELSGVTRTFRGRAALNKINLSIKRGELFGIVGPDGAGKSTLLRLMAAVMNPTEGHLRLNNLDTVQDQEAVKAQMGYMPQQFGLYADLSVQENLNFVADVYNVRGSHRQQRMADPYEFTQLGDFKKRPAGLLSGGMKKKLGLACALIHHPPILLLDEPTTGVDPVARRDFWDLLSGLHGEGTTTVVSTPYMDEAERCNRVALIYEGRIMACDTPKNIKAMVPGKVLALRAENIRQAKNDLAQLPFLLDMQTYGDQLNLIISGSIEDAQHAIRNTLSDVQRLESVPIRMEEAFIYLVNQAKKEVAA